MFPRFIEKYPALWYKCMIFVYLLLQPLNRF